MPGYHDWLEKAASDLRSSQKLTKDGDDTLDTAVYHTQQCAEKALKAYLVFKNQPVPRTHDLQKILELCAQLDYSFKILLNDVLDLLPFATYSRYPDDRFLIERQEAIEAIDKAKTIFDFVKNKVKNSGSNQNIF